MTPKIARWLPIAQAVAPLYGQDPLLVLAIAARESGGDPSIIGDGGHGHGLAQIDDRYHPTLIAAKLPDGKFLWAEPAFALLLIAYWLHMGVRLFEAIVDHPIIPSICNFNVSYHRIFQRLHELTRPTSEEQLIAVLNPLTTPSQPGGSGDYISDVLARKASFVLNP